MGNLKHDCFPLYPYTPHSVKALEDWLAQSKSYRARAALELQKHDDKRIPLAEELTRRTAVVNDIQHAIQILKERENGK